MVQIFSINAVVFFALVGVACVMADFGMNRGQPGCGIFVSGMLAFFVWNFVIEVYGVDALNAAFAGGIIGGMLMEIRTVMLSVPVLAPSTIFDNFNRLPEYSQERGEE